MVAMAILIIMMGFLLQFVNGARRIWMSSTVTAEAFDDGQIVLQVIENDLKNIVQHGDNHGQKKLQLLNNLDSTHVNTTNNRYLIFPTGQDNAGNPAIIIYGCVEENGRTKLYRYAVSPTDTRFSPSWFNLSSSASALDTCFRAAHSAHDDVLVCDDINRLQAFTVANPNQPGEIAALKLTLALNLENRTDTGEASNPVREFSKLVFLP
jgi:hypothetical protein